MNPRAVFLFAIFAASPATANECEAFAAGVAAATRIPAQPSGQNAFAFDMLGIHSRMYLFCGAPNTTISARDYAERIPPPDLMAMASVAAAQFGKEAPDKVYAAVSSCVQQALRSKTNTGRADLASMYMDCLTVEDRSEINISPTVDPIP